MLIKPFSEKHLSWCRLVFYSFLLDEIEKFLEKENEYWRVVGSHLDLTSDPVYISLRIRIELFQGRQQRITLY
jgi:hypothetical protein